MIFSNGRSFILHIHYTTSYRDRTEILDLQGFSRRCLQSSLNSEFHWSMIPLKTAFIFMQLPSAFPVADTAMAWICNISPNDTSLGFSENSSRWGLDEEGECVHVVAACSEAIHLSLSSSWWLPGEQLLLYIPPSSFFPQCPLVPFSPPASEDIFYFI